MSNNKSTSDEYAEAYKDILNTYSNQIKITISKKTLLKEDYLKMIKKLMSMMSWLLIASIIGSMLIFILMIWKGYHSVTMIAGAITSIITAVSPMIFAILNLPKIIADYLFNKEEDSSMSEIIKSIQDYTIESKKLDEKMAPYKSKEDISGSAVNENPMFEVHEPTTPSQDFDLDDSQNQDNENIKE